jgi:hypothetical protein
MLKEESFMDGRADAGNAYALSSTIYSFAGN